MCYSAQIYADLSKYEHFGDLLNLREFVKVFWVELSSDEAYFYSFTIITSEPPPEA
jgi:hypothetical protein